jgi:hypothetical protein
MCCIALCIDNKPNLATIQKIHHKNDDLIGIAWIKDGDNSL